eukprot:NP_509550.1 Uncharacterized protein CELE_Y81B9A.2 [Caenorhabditis elegans]
MDESNVSQELLNSNRTEIARCVLLKDLVVMYGGYEVYANHVDLLMCFHQLMIVLAAPPIKPMQKEPGTLLPPRAVVYKLPAIKGSMKDAFSAHKLLKKSYAKPIVDISSTSGDSDPEWWSDRELTPDLNLKRELLLKKARFSRKTFDKRSSYIAHFKKSHLENYLNSDSDTVSNEKPKTLAQLKNFSKSNLVEYHPSMYRDVGVVIIFFSIYYYDLNSFKVNSEIEKQDKIFQEYKKWIFQSVQERRFVSKECTEPKVLSQLHVHVHQN